MGLIYDDAIINKDFVDLSLSDEVTIFTPDDSVSDTIDFSGIDSIDERMTMLDDAIKNQEKEAQYLLFSYTY